MFRASQQSLHITEFARAEDDQGYYLNEGMGGAAEVRMTRNEVYGTSKQPRSDNGTSTEDETHINTGYTYETSRQLAMRLNSGTLSLSTSPLISVSLSKYSCFTKLKLNLSAIQ